MKHLTARKCKDGEWIVRIVDTIYLKSKSEVMQLCRQTGLKIRSNEDGEVYAD